MFTKMNTINGVNGDNNFKEFLSITYTYNSTATYLLNKIENDDVTTGTCDTVQGDYLKAVNRASSGFKFTLSALKAGKYWVYARGAIPTINKIYDVNSADRKSVV